MSHVNHVLTTHLPKNCSKISCCEAPYKCCCAANWPARAGKVIHASLYRVILSQNSILFRIIFRCIVLRKIILAIQVLSVDTATIIRHIYGITRRLCDRPCGAEVPLRPSQITAPSRLNFSKHRRLFFDPTVHRTVRADARLGRP